MIRSNSGAVVLDKHETRLLAQEMAARRLSDPEEWAAWELVPSLDEDGHVQLIEAIREVTAIQLDDDPGALTLWEAVQ
jgi:hypothetical protein